MEGETGEFEFNLSWASCTSMLKLLLSVPGATPSRGRAYNGETPVISIKVDADVPAAFAPGWSFHAADAAGTSASTRSGVLSLLNPLRRRSGRSPTLQNTEETMRFFFWRDDLRVVRLVFQRNLVFRSDPTSH